MASKSWLVVLLVSCVAVVYVAGQLCNPGPVENLRVTLDSTLLWSTSSTDNCTTNYYLIYIRNDTGTVYTYAVSGTRLALTFLPICESYLFTVIPVSNDHIEGTHVELYSKMPFPPEADLTISVFSVSSRDNAVYLEWQVPPEWSNCAERFRVTVFDEDVDIPVDLYVSDNYITLTGLIPCAHYLFGVRAIYNLEDEGSFASTRYTTPAASLPAPTLRSISIARTTVDLSWQLASYYLNRCAVSSISVNASPYFQVTYPILDQTNRPPVSVRLTGLSPDTLYLLNVTVLNTGGRTQPTLLAVQTLE